MNAKNCLGNTPLHVAMMADRCEAIRELVVNCADCDVKLLNHKKLAAIHVAVEANKVNALKAFASIEGMDVNLKGNQGQTAMHLAAELDKAACVEVLVSSAILDY